MIGIGGGGFGNKPRALMCYICGREYGTTSLQIHLKTCMKKWEIEESKKPKKERRPMPQPPQQLLGVLDRINGGENVKLNDLEDYNKKANDEYNEKALIFCEFCNRTFLPERLGIHRKICTAEKPFKPLPPPANRGGGGSTSTTTTSTTSSKTMGGNTGYSAGGNSKYGGGGGYEEEEYSKPTPKKVGGLKVQSKPQYEEEEYEDSYQAPKSTKASTQMSKPTQSKPMQQARNQGYGGGGMIAEYQNVQLAECNLCGRSFAVDRLDRHQKACTKTQKGEAKHAKKVALAQKKQQETEKFIAKEQKFKKNNWREQHNEFVANLKYNRKLKAVEEQGGDIRSLGPAPKMSAIESNMVECPYCNRKFNPQSADKHINICKNVVNKPKFQVANSGAGAHNRFPASSTTSKGMAASKASPTKTFGSQQGGASSYGKFSTNSYNDYDEPSYNPNNYGSNSNRMTQSKPSYGASPPTMKNKPTDPVKRSMEGSLQGRAMGGQYGGGQTMNTSARGGGFAVNSGKGPSSLSNVGRMAMQSDYRYNQGPSKPTPKSGYPY